MDAAGIKVISPAVFISCLKNNHIANVLMRNLLSVKNLPYYMHI